MQAQLRTAVEQHAVAAREGDEVEVLLDEAGNTAPLRDLPGYASTARSHSITLVSIWQDLAQIRSLYGDLGTAILNNHKAKIFGTSIADAGTLAPRRSDALNLAMLKDAQVAGRIGGKLYDVVCQFKRLR